MLPYNVTGCIVTYNNMGKIEDTIESVLAKTKGVSFQLFVVDNASTDGTPEWITENYPEVTLIKLKKNVGFGTGHNQVLPSIHSKYHIIINPDITLPDDVIKTMCEYMQLHEDIVLLSPKILFPEGDEQILGRRRPWLPYLFASRLRGKVGQRILKRYAMMDEDLSKPIEIKNATGCFMAVRTDAFREVRGFDENYFLYFEDCDLTRCLEYVGRVVYNPDVFVYHIWSRGSKNSSNLLKIHVHSMTYYYYKWYVKRVIKKGGILL